VSVYAGRIVGCPDNSDTFGMEIFMEKMISYKDGRIVSHTGPYYRPWQHDPVFSDELQKVIREAI